MKSILIAIVAGAFGYIFHYVNWGAIAGPFPPAASSAFQTARPPTTAPSPTVRTPVAATPVVPLHPAPPEPPALWSSQPKRYTVSIDVSPVTPESARFPDVVVSYRDERGVRRQLRTIAGKTGKTDLEYVAFDISVSVMVRDCLDVRVSLYRDGELVAEKTDKYQDRVWLHVSD